MKKLRKYFKHKIRSYGCAEYGEKYGRPHFHICLFNLTFKDKTLWKTHNGQDYYHSKTLDKIWGKGSCVIGDVTFESAAYVARYVTKKITGKRAKSHYGDRPPEQSVCVSRRPGIGAQYLKKWKGDIFPSDEVIVRGRQMRPPKYYDRLYELTDPEAYGQTKISRELKIIPNNPNNKKSRSMDRAYILEYKFTQLKRGYENAA
jgi:hypothetical protein